MAFKPPLGWIDFNDRTREQSELAEQAVGAMPEFKIVASAERTTDEKKILLTDLWKHEAVKSALGFEFTRFHQLTGSCVGAGGGNALVTLNAWEVVKKGDPELIVLPWWLYNYGQSRKRGGMRGRGEGSFGSTFAESVRLDGVVNALYPGLPKFRNEDGVVIGQSVEMEWSDGNHPDDALIAEAKVHPVQTTAKMRSADDVRESIRNGYPVTIACSGYVNSPRVKGSGDNAVLYGIIDASGGHQTTLQGWWEHPEFGEQYLYVNQWPKGVYPTDPAGGPPCSCWVSKKTVEWIVAQGEAFSLSGYEGYPAQSLHWLM